MCSSKKANLVSISSCDNDDASAGKGSGATELLARVKIGKLEAEREIDRPLQKGCDRRKKKKEEKKKKREKGKIM